MADDAVFESFYFWMDWNSKKAPDQAFVVDGKYIGSAHFENYPANLPIVINATNNTGSIWFDGGRKETDKNIKALCYTVTPEWVPVDVEAIPDGYHFIKFGFEIGYDLYMGRSLGKEKKYFGKVFLDGPYKGIEYEDDDMEYHRDSTFEILAYNINTFG